MESGGGLHLAQFADMGSRALLFSMVMGLAAWSSFENLLEIQNPGSPPH